MAPIAHTLTKHKSRPSRPSQLSGVIPFAFLMPSNMARERWTKSSAPGQRQRRGAAPPQRTIGIADLVVVARRGLPARPTHRVKEWIQPRCVLPRLPRAIGARLSRVFSDPAARRPTARISEKSIAGLYRASADQRYHVKRGARPQSRDDSCACDEFRVSIPSRSGALRTRWSLRDDKSFRTEFPTPILRHAPPVMVPSYGEQIPRLAGQLYWYVIKELGIWGTERGQNPAKPDTSATMRPIAHSLNKPQMEAVAAYVSSLK